MELELVRHSGSVGRGQKAATAQPRLLRAGEVNNGHVILAAQSSFTVHFPITRPSGSQSFGHAKKYSPMLLSKVLAQRLLLHMYARLKAFYDNYILAI